MTDNDKHSSLLENTINYYGQKKFYSTGPICLAKVVGHNDGDAVSRLLTQNHLSERHLVNTEQTSASWWDGGAVWLRHVPAKCQSAKCFSAESRETVDAASQKFVQPQKL